MIYEVILSATIKIFVYKMCFLSRSNQNGGNYFPVISLVSVPIHAVEKMNGTPTLKTSMIFKISKKKL